MLIALTVKRETTVALDRIAQRLPIGARSTVSRELVALGKLLPRSRKLPKLLREILETNVCISKVPTFETSDAFYDSNNQYSELDCMLIRDSGPRLSEDDISEFEVKHQVALPEDYRTFMLECNGGSPFPDAFLAPNGDVEVTVSKFLTLYYAEDVFGSVADLWRDPAWSEAIEAGFIQIATDSGGQRILMKTKGENIGRIVIQIDGEYFFAASSFNDFLNRLEKYEGFEKDILYRIKEEAILAKPQEERGHVYHIPT